MENRATAYLAPLVYLVYGRLTRIMGMEVLARDQREEEKAKGN